MIEALNNAQKLAEKNAYRAGWLESELKNVRAMLQSGNSLTHEIVADIDRSLARMEKSISEKYS